MTEYVVFYTDEKGVEVTFPPMVHGAAVDKARRLGVGMLQRQRESIGLRLVRKVRG